MTAAAQQKVIQLDVDTASGVSNVQSLTQAFQQLAGTNPAVAALTSQLQSLNGATAGAANNNNAAGAATSALTSRFGALGSSAQAAMTRVSGMTGSLGGIATAGAGLALTAVAGGLIALGSAAVSASAKMEAYRASLTTVLGDADKASMAMDRLAQFAAKTPFSLDQAVEGFTKLKALGLTPSEEAMTSYGNTASSMGKSLDQMVEAVADAATGEFERLKEFGIKASSQGDKVKFTFQGVTKEVGKNSADIQAYLMAIGNTNFAGAMDKQSKTFNGAMSNLSDTWDQTLAKIGDGGLLNSMGRVVSLLSDGITALTPVLVSVGNAMGGIVDGLSSVGSGVGDMLSVLNVGGASGVTILERITFSFNVIGQVAQVAGSIIGGVFSAAGTLIQGAASILNGAFGGALEAVGINFENGGRSWSNSLFGVLRAAKAVAMALPQIFKIAVNDLLGMFSTLGQAIGALLTGQWDKAKALASKPLFTNTDRAISAAGRIATATYRDEAGANRAMNKMFGRTTARNIPSLSDLAGAAPKADPSGKGKGDKDAADKAKRENEFWETLKGELATAQAFGLELQKLTKERELQKILSRDLTTDEKSRVDSIVTQITQAKAITALKQAAFEGQNKYNVELLRTAGLTESQKAVEDELFKYRLAALNSGAAITSDAYKTEEDKLRKILEQNQALADQQKLMKDALATAKRYSTAFDTASQIKDIDKARADFIKAFNAGGGVIDGQTISQQVYDAVLSGMDRARADLKNKPLLDALGVAADGGSSVAAAELARRKADAKYANAKDALAVAGLSPADFAVASKQIAANHTEEMLRANRIVANDFTDAFVSGLDDLADRFGGVFGDVLKGFADIATRISRDADGTSGTAKFLTKISGSLGEGFTSAAKRMSLDPANLKSAFNDLKKPLDGLLKGFNPREGGSFLKGIGSAVGGAMQGQQIGQGVGSLMGALGIKNASKGAQIGGTIGGLTGNPIIAAGAAAIGGLIGSIFHKAKYGTAQLTGAGAASLSGRGGEAQKLAGGAAGDVQSGLASIANQLGAKIGSYMVSIGQYDGKWRVSTSGQTGEMSFGKKNKANWSTLHDFGDDQAAAIAYAIKDAIKDGALTGMSEFAQKAVNALDIDAAIAAVKDFNAVLDDFAAMTDPIGAAVKAINDPLDKLRATMVSVGASTNDLTKVDQYRTLKLKEALKSQLGDLNKFLDALNGDAGGVSQLSQLTTKLASFEDYRKKIAAGDSSVNQADFTALGQDILSLASAVYGTTTGQFQDIRAMLLGSTTGLVENVTKAFNQAGGSVDTTVVAIDATTTAIQAQTDTLAAQQAIANDYLRQIAANSANSNNIVYYGSDRLVQDGQFIGKTY